MHSRIGFGTRTDETDSSGCAKKQLSRDDVEQLKIAGNAAEDLLQVRPNGTGELVNEEMAIGPENGVGFANNNISHSVGQSFKGNTGNDVIRFVTTELGKHLVDIRCGSLHEMIARVRERTLKEPEKLRVDFQGNELRIRAHPFQDAPGKSTHARAIFDDHLRCVPIDYAS